MNVFPVTISIYNCNSTLTACFKSVLQQDLTNKNVDLKFLSGFADATPCPDASFGVVVSFETTKHHKPA